MENQIGMLPGGSIVTEEPVQDASREMESPTYASIEQIEEALGVPEEEFTIELTAGLKVRVKCINNASDLVAYQKKLETMLEVAKDGTCPEQWKPWLPQDDSVIQGAASINQLLIEPKVTMAKALEWAATRGPLFWSLVGPITERLTQATEVGERQAIDAEKND
jgi:hypothetical protein